MGEKVYGLLGRKLGHSWSAPIHAALGCADYRLIELEPEELGAFLAREDIGGLNVTIPYKRDVMAYCDVLDPMAEAIGSVNTAAHKAVKICFFIRIRYVCLLICPRSYNASPEYANFSLNAP